MERSDVRLGRTEIAPQLYWVTMKTSQKASAEDNATNPAELLLLLCNAPRKKPKLDPTQHIQAIYTATHSLPIPEQEVTIEFTL